MPGGEMALRLASAGKASVKELMIARRAKARKVSADPRLPMVRMRVRDAPSPHHEIVIEESAPPGVLL
jgi:hypothetical protein